MTARIRHTLCCLALVSLARPPHLSAQTAPPRADPGQSLEQLLSVEVDSVVGATRHRQRTTEAPASVTIITANDIETFGWRTLADVLRSVRGFHVTYDRNYSYVGVRAFGRPTDYNNRVLVSIDGHRFNDSIYDGALIGTEFPLDLSLVDRIEVIRGPGSALYGTSAFLAVINIMTKRGTQVGGREVALEGATFGDYKVRATHAWSDNRGHDLLVSATRQDSRGPHELIFPEFAGPGTNGGRAFDLDGDQSTKVYAAATIEGFRLQGVFGEREKRVPTASWDTTFGDPRYFTRDTRSWASAEYTKEVGATSVQTRAYYDHYRYYGDYPYDIVSFDGALADAVGGEASVRRRVGRRHLLTAGVEQRTNLRQNQWNGNAEEMLVDDHRSSREFATYGQDEIAFSPRLTGIIGGRYDWWSQRGGTGRPRLGLVYRTEADTAIKLLYGEAYRAPNMYELYYGTGQVVSLANATLEPELVRTTELAFERYVTRRLRVTATGYFTRIAHLIDASVTSDGNVFYANQEAVRSTGFEVEGETRWPSGLLVRGSLALQRAEASASRDRLSNAPGRLGTMQAAFPFWRRQVLLASDTTFTSARMTVGAERLPSYWMNNVTATYRPVTWPIVVGAAVYNAFDARYTHPVGVEFRQVSIPQDGRTAALRLTVKF